VVAPFQLIVAKMVTHAVVGLLVMGFVLTLHSAAPVTDGAERPHNTVNTLLSRKRTTDNNHFIFSTL